MSIAQLKVKVPAYTPQSYSPILDVPTTYWVYAQNRLFFSNHIHHNTLSTIQVEVNFSQETVALNFFFKSSRRFSKQEQQNLQRSDHKKAVANSSNTEQQIKKAKTVHTRMFSLPQIDD